MDRPRPRTDTYLYAVNDAVSRPGVWVKIPRNFESQMNASVTASCLEQGFLRVTPRKGDVSVAVNGKRYIATAGPVRTRLDEADGVWQLSIIHDAMA